MNIISLTDFEKFLPVGIVMTDQGSLTGEAVKEIEIPTVVIYSRRFSNRYKNGFRKRALTSVLTAEITKKLIDLLIEKGDTVNGTYTVAPINHPVDDTPVGDPNTCITFSPKISKSGPIRHNGARLCITSPTTMQIQFN